MDIIFTAASGNLAVGRILLRGGTYVVDVRWTRKTVSQADMDELAAFVETRIGGSKSKTHHHIVEANEPRRRAFIEQLLRDLQGGGDT